MVEPVVPPTDPRRDHHRDLRSDCVPATRPCLGPRSNNRQRRTNLPRVWDQPQDVLQVAQHRSRVRTRRAAAESETAASDAERDTDSHCRGVVDTRDHDAHPRLPSVRRSTARPGLHDRQIMRAEPVDQTRPRSPPPTLGPRCCDHGADDRARDRSSRRGRTVRVLPLVRKAWRPCRS